MDGTEQSAATAGYSALVRGPSAVFPRGTLWVLCFGYAVAYVILVVLVKEPLSINLIYLAGFIGSAIALSLVFGRAKYRAFAADDAGIWLGKNTTRPLRLKWEQVRQLKISPYPHGAVLEILLSSGHRPTGRTQQILSLALLYVPFGIRRARPGLLTVLPDPPRYRVPLTQVTPEELRSALSALAPAAFPIETRL